MSSVQQTVGIEPCKAHGAYVGLLLVELQVGAGCLRSSLVEQVARAVGVLGWGGVGEWEWVGRWEEECMTK